MLRYPEVAVWDEVSYLAYQVHWGLDELLDLPHRDRVRLVGLVAGQDQRHGERKSDG